MINYKNYCNLISKLIKKNNFDNDVISVYAYGSIAQGNFEKNYSDTDLWFVVKCDSLQERITLSKKLSNVLDVELKTFLDEAHKVKENKKYHYHDNYYFTEEEFKKYFTAYPTRVLYPFKKNIWKLAYGKDYFSDLELPSREICVEYLQYDYEMFSNDFHWLAFTNNTREMIKYFLRALKKAIWILKNDYLASKDEVLEKANIIFSDDKLIGDIIEKIKCLKEKDYFLVGSEYLDMYLDLCKILEIYGLNIKNYVIKNKFTLINKDKLYSTSTWGSFIWGFAASINEYISIDKNDKNKLTNLLVVSYSHFMKCFNYMVINNLKAEKVLIGKSKTPPLRSKILNNMDVDRALYNDIIKLKGFIFLIDKHRENVLKNIFSDMNSIDIINYIENTYFPAIYEVYYYLLKR